jgi:hypothetical protein
MIDDFRPVRRPDKNTNTPPPQAKPYRPPDGPLLTGVKSPDQLKAERGQLTKPPVHPALPAPKKKLQLSMLWTWWPRHWSKKKQILLGVAIALAVIALIANLVWAWKIMHKKPPAEPVIKKAQKKEEPPKPTSEASRLTGMEVSPEVNKRPVTGIMIENSPDARPQSGLKDAGVVFEAVAEGGITRFLALYQEARPDYIGPVRSARPYYLEWLAPFDASYAHVGGSPDALATIKALGLRDLDQFANSGAYQRVSNRFAPHNVYTSMDKMDELNNKKGFNTSTFEGFARKPDKPPDVPPSARVINLNISSSLYNVHYDYDRASNTYKRVLGGKPHTDERSKAQLAPKVVIALVTQKGLASDRLHTTYQTVGQGKMYVFQDGVLTEGTWAKSSAKAQFAFTDASGAPIKLNAGQTWLTHVAANTDVSAGP